MTDARRSLGRSSEDAAAAYLARHGLMVAARNVRFAEGEIDLVCRDGTVWVFVEVKSRRAGWGETPATAVTAQKQRRLVRLAQHYLKSRHLDAARCRFDVVAITLEHGGGIRDIAHLRDAFGAEAW